MTQEELKLMLKAHDKNERHHTLAETRYWCEQYKLLAKQAIKALAQPVAEPVAWIAHANVQLGTEDGKPQRTWVGLTEEEELKLAQDSMGKSRHWLVAQVEAKLKEKNT